MKKLITFAACAMLAAISHGATVGWTMATGSTSYAGYAYDIFVIGQSGVESVATITALLDAGTSVDSYAFGTGAIGSNGNVTVLPAASGKSLDAGTYTSFMVVFDTATPSAGDSQYVVISGGANQTKTIAATTANTSFVAGNVSSTLSNADNWKSYGAVPEPTSGLLMLLGMAGLALRRRRA